MFSLDVGLHEHRCMPDVTHSDRVVTHEFQDSSSEDIFCIKVFDVFSCHSREMLEWVMGYFTQSVFRMSS